jgi:hypothetical protein
MRSGAHRVTAMVNAAETLFCAVTDDPDTGGSLGGINVQGSSAKSARPSL